AAQGIAAQLKKIGIPAEIENVEYAVWIKRWLAKDFDMTMNTTPGYADPDTAFFRALHSTKGQNWNSWSVPELDALLEDGRRTMEYKKRKEIYDRVQIMILENVPHLWLYSADTIDFTQTAVKGFKQHPTTLLYGFEGVWLDKAWWGPPRGERPRRAARRGGGDPAGLGHGPIRGRPAVLDGPHPARAHRAHLPHAAADPGHRRRAADRRGRHREPGHG